MKGASSRSSSACQGTLTINSQVIQATDALSLGLAAWAAGVGSVKVSRASAPLEPMSITARRRSRAQELAILDGSPERGIRAESLFIKQFQAAIHVATTANMQPKALLDWWESCFLQDALTLLSPALRARSRFERGVYDSNGDVLSATQIERAAKFARMAAVLSGEKPMAGEVLIPWEHVSRSADPYGPIALNGPARAAVQKMLVPLGFPRLPANFAELRAAWEFCRDVSMATISPFGGPADPGWTRGIVGMNRRHFSRTAVLFEACVVGDLAVVAELQAQRDWLAELATYFQLNPERIARDAS